MSFFVTGKSLIGQAKDQPKTDIVVAVGTDFIHQTAIKAKRRVFNASIYKIYFDSASNNLTLQLGNGDAVVFNIDKDETLWTQKVDYSKFFLLQAQNILVQSGKEESYRLNIKTGYKDFQLKNAVSYMDASLETGIGFVPQKSGIPNKLVGVNLKNGNICWQREILRDYSKNCMCHLNDSTLLFCASGLHTVNIKTGQGWDYNTETGEKSYKDIDSKTALGKKIGLWGGTYSKYDGRGLLTDIVSNVLIDTNYLYIASQERLVKLSRETGNIIWSYEFKDNEASTSRILWVDNKLVLLNTGYALLNHEKVKCGESFIASFDTATGSVLYKNKIVPDKWQMVDFAQNNDRLFIIFPYKIVSYDLHTGQMITQKTMSGWNDENIIFAYKTYYQNTGDSIRPSIRQLDMARQFVITNEHHLLEFDNDLNLISTSSDRRLYAVRNSNNKFKIIGKLNNNKMFIINSANNAIAHFEAPANSVLVNNKLYGIDDNTLVETDISEIMK